jgi:hypothetical protein
MLRGRGRGDQHLRRDIPRPPAADPNIKKRVQIYELINKARSEESARHLVDAHQYAKKALRLAMELPDASETSLASQIEYRIKILNAKIRHRERRFLRPFLDIQRTAQA